MSNLEERLAQLESELADLRKRWPAHSVKPQMVEEMEMIEDEIAQLRKMRRDITHSDSLHG